MEERRGLLGGEFVLSFEYVFCEDFFLGLR